MKKEQFCNEIKSISLECPIPKQYWGESTTITLRDDSGREGRAVVGSECWLNLCKRLSNAHGHKPLSLIYYMYVAKIGISIYTLNSSTNNFQYTQ